MANHKPTRKWFLSFSPEEIARYTGQTKWCNKCGLTLDIIEHFGLYRRKGNKIAPRSYCFKCVTKATTDWYAERAGLRTEIHRKWVEKNRNKSRINAKIYYDKNPDKWIAQSKAKRAYPIAQICEVDGCTVKGTRHHDDYSKPLEIRWLCHSHHMQHHKEIYVNQICGQK